MIGCQVGTGRLLLKDLYISLVHPVSSKPKLKSLIIWTRSEQEEGEGGNIPPAPHSLSLLAKRRRCDVARRPMRGGASPAETYQEKEEKNPSEECAHGGREERYN